jgi:hypothetical protein
MNVLDATAAILYAAGMALVFGGTAALSFAAAPSTFRLLRPVDAGRVFGRTLRVFDAMAWAGAVGATLAAVVAAVRAPGPVPLVLATLGACVAALLFLVRRGIAPRMAALKPPETEEEERVWDPEKRRAFHRLHVQYVRVYSANLFLSLAAIAIHAASR